MKKITSLVVILLLMLVVATGYAQVKAGSVHVTPTIGMYKFEGNEDTNSAINLGLRAGYNFTKYIGVEGYGHWTPTGPIGEAEWSRGSDVNVFGYGIEGIFHILPNGAFVPFVAAGVGGVHYSTTWQDTFENKRNKITADYGAGFKYFLSDNIALRADVRHVLPFQDKHNNFLGTVGLTFAFGGAKKAVASAPEPVAPPPPVVQEVRPQAAAPVVVEEIKPQAAAPVVVQEVKPQPRVAKEIVEKGRTTLNVLFDFDKSSIKKNAFADINDLVAVMKQYTDLNVTIEGHTDSKGSAAYNKKLSQRRADAIKKYMVEKGGIDAKRLNAVGFGLEKPVASNATKEGRAKNRRVEAATAEYIIKK
ncbi:MAG: OmpA-OmpF porin OOP family [Syntrophaceae bacterium]|nr:MAG: OmpA-OmpF porin OOP family [Syntrophaceae bacterium]